MTIRQPGIKIPRPRRMKFAHPSHGYYHVVSRALQKEFRFNEQEKRTFLDLLRWLSKIYFVRVATFTILENQVHLVIKMIAEEDISIEELRRRMEIYYEKDLPPGMEEAFEQGNTDDFYAHFSDISMFMWDLKLRFSRWYNRVHKGYGHVWAERFTSVMVVGAFALRAVMIYVELNAMRAAIVERPEQYTYSGLYLYLAGGRAAAWLDTGLLEEAVSCVPVCPDDEQGPVNLPRAYLSAIYSEGLYQTEEVVKAAIEGKNCTLDPTRMRESVFMHRIPAMTQGVFLGDEAVCETLYKAYFPYFRASKVRKSKGIISTTPGLSSEEISGYLEYLHSLPPPRKNDAMENDSEEDYPENSNPE